MGMWHMEKNDHLLHATHPHVPPPRRRESEIGLLMRRHLRRWRPRRPPTSPNGLTGTEYTFLKLF